MMHQCTTPVLLGVTFLATCVALCNAADDPEADKKLIAAVKAAVEKGTEAKKVEEVVGDKATLNTIRQRDKGAFSRADIVADPDQKPALPDRDSLLYVAYWVRPVESHNPKLIGIYWPKDGKPQVFYGEILPPGG